MLHLRFCINLLLKGAIYAIELADITTSKVIIIERELLGQLVIHLIVERLFCCKHHDCFTNDYVLLHPQ